MNEQNEAISIEACPAARDAEAAAFLREVLYHEFGFTPDRVVAAAHASLERVGVITGDKTGS